MRSDVQREVADAYLSRGKGQSSGRFVDHTRNGAYLEVDCDTGEARVISADEYHDSSLPKYEDGR